MFLQQSWLTSTVRARSMITATLNQTPEMQHSVPGKTIKWWSHSDSPHLESTVSTLWKDLGLKPGRSM